MPKTVEVASIKTGRKNRVIYINIFTEKGKIRVNVDNRLQINIISLKVVD